MSEFTEKDIEKLSRLCRIACSVEERGHLQKHLSRIVTHIEALAEVDTTGVPPCNHALEEIVNVMREDVVGEVLPREVFLGNAPQHTGGMIRVPPVIHQE